MTGDFSTLGDVPIRHGSRPPTDGPEDAVFDPAVGAWILSRYADVSAALRSASLSPSSAALGTLEKADVASTTTEHHRSPAHIADWSAVATSTAASLAARLPLDAPIDLVRDFAAPLSLDLAVDAIGATPGAAGQLSTLARRIFLDAAHATSGDANAELSPTITALAEALNANAGHALLTEKRFAPSLAVQSFVALSQTLPCFLASAWLVLVDRRNELAMLAAAPERLPTAIEELLRLAGPSRAVFRVATADLTLGSATIGRGDRVTLLLGAANRDATRFPDPTRLDLSRDASGHLAFGRGTHSCVGSQPIRTAAVAATRALLAAAPRITQCGDVEWLDGYAIRAPLSLPVTLGR